MLTKTIVSTLLLMVFLSLVSFTSSNQCVRFDGSYAIFPSSPVLRPKKEITVECWIKAEKYYNWAAPISYIVDNKYDESGFALEFNEGKMRFIIKTDQMRSQDRNFNPGAEIELNHWCHIAGVYNGKSIKFYLNGVLMEEKYVNGDIDWTFIPDQLCVGAFLDNNELHQFSGCVDEVRIWNRGLSSNEIKDGMSKQLKGEEDGLIFYLPVTETSSVMKDHSINHFDGNIINYKQDTRITSLAMMQPEISKVNILSPSSFNIEWNVPDMLASCRNYFIDVSHDSKFRTILPRYKAVVSDKNSIVLSNIPGGDNLYIRVKGKTNNGDFSVYSEPFLVDQFSNSLSVSVIVKTGEESKSYLIVDNNVLAADSYKFPMGTENIIFNTSMSVKGVQLDNFANLAIDSKAVNDNYDIGQRSKVILSKPRSGSYLIKLNWGSKQKGALRSEFSFEVEKYWWQNRWFHGFMLLVLSFVIYLFIRRIVILKRLTYEDLIASYSPELEKSLNISEDELELYYNQLLDHMQEDKPYLQHRLNIQLLSDKLELPTYLLSNIINKKEDLNFNDFINKYRIERAKYMLTNKDTSNLKIATIAHDCGFNSESTFFRVFKKFTGKTPSQYQK